MMKWIVLLVLVSGCADVTETKKMPPGVRVFDDGLVRCYMYNERSISCVR
jgi:hypothetical protein